MSPLQVVGIQVISTTRPRSVCLWHLYDNESVSVGHGWVHMFIRPTHCLQLNLQLHNIDLVRTCRTSSFCTDAWQLVRFQLTRRIARSLSDSWTFCLNQWREPSYDFLIRTMATPYLPSKPETFCFTDVLDNAHILLTSLCQNNLLF